MLKVDKDLEKYLTQILDQSKNGVIITDPNQDGNPVIFVNQTTCNIFKYQREDFLGRNCNFLHNGDVEQLELQQMKAAIKKKEHITVAVRNYTKEGQLVYNQVTISPIFDGDENLKYFLGVQRDITKEVLLTQENQALQEQRIDNAQYQAIGKLSAGLSHEINTPLTVINGTMEMLKSSIEALECSAEKEYILEDLSSIQDNLNRIKNITESMREIGDTRYFQIEDINLYRTIVIALRLTYHKSKDIANINLLGEKFDLDIDREKQSFPIKGDYQKLEQVFIAIIDNALDQFELNSSLKNKVLNIEIKEKNSSYELVFYDNAGGIDENLLPDIFKPFKGDKKHKGLGIGLSVVKKIIDKHDFDIDICNFKDGAKVTIEIPKNC